MIATNEQIIQTIEQAMLRAERRGDNWADAVDLALAKIGVEVDEEASRKAWLSDDRTIGVLSDGRWIWQAEDSKDIIIA